EDPADLTAVLFDGVDKLQHLCWRFLDAACETGARSKWEQEGAERCAQYFHQFDGLIAEIVSLAGPDATVVLASYDGLGPTSAVFYFNIWLEQQGLLSWAVSIGAMAMESSKLGMGQITRHVYQLDWEKTLVYAGIFSSNGIHIVMQTN